LFEQFSGCINNAHTKHAISQQTSKPDIVVTEPSYLAKEYHN